MHEGSKSCYNPCDIGWQTITERAIYAMQTVSNAEPIAPEAEFFQEEAYASDWAENDEDEPMPYASVDRKQQVLRLILLLMLIIVAAAFVVFVLLPAIDALLNPAPLPSMQPPVQV